MTDDTPEQLRDADTFDAEREPRRKPARNTYSGPLFDPRPEPTKEKV